MSAASLTCFEKIWQAHVIISDPDGSDLLHIDRHYLTDLSATIGFEDMAARGNSIFDPQRTFVMPDHVIETGDDATAGLLVRDRFIVPLDQASEERGLTHFSRGSGTQGIVHIVGLEQGLSLPGTTIVCGDSHTSTNGAIGAIAFGIGQTEIRHVLATQTIRLRKPQLARITIDGGLAPGVFAKDVVLAVIGRLGADYGREHAIEFAGTAIAGFSIEERATVCNLAVELGARFALVAPDAKASAYVQNLPYAPKGAARDTAMVEWATLVTDPSAAFDKEAHIDATMVTPQVTWGTSPEQVANISASVPSIGGHEAIYDYIGLKPGDQLDEVPIDIVFIGSCTNSRIEDLRAAAAVAQQGSVAPGVRALIVPGSEKVRAQAEAEGLADIFRRAGFEWRLPGCSMCVAINGDVVPPGKRCVSTSNRNFVGRQGHGARTHLASPATAAASALTGRIADPTPYFARPRT